MYLCRKNICRETNGITQNIHVMRIFATMLLATAILTGCGDNPKKMVERRRAARAEFLDSLLNESKEKLRLTDSILQAEKAEYKEMLATVEQHRKDLTVTKEELEELNRKFVRIDSLKTKFDVDCGRVKFIHKKQRMPR